MSSSIWTRCGRRLSPLVAEPWRAVESQHIISTRKLVDSTEEHDLLESLIDGAKPPPPREASFRGLHYLLFTPFRYPPLPNGSRFGARSERGIWYGSDTVETALAERAYYKLLAHAGTTARLPSPFTGQITLFQAKVSTRRGVDLSTGPFARHRALISSPTDYGASQLLGREMRADEVHAFRYASARDPAGGTNVGVFDPAAFARAKPTAQQEWFFTLGPDAVEYEKRDLIAPVTKAFPKATFLVDGKLPEPAF